MRPAEHIVPVSLRALSNDKYFNNYETISAARNGRAVHWLHAFIDFSDVFVNCLRFTVTFMNDGCIASKASVDWTRNCQVFRYVCTVQRQEALHYVTVYHDYR